MGRIEEESNKILNKYIVLNSYMIKQITEKAYTYVDKILEEYTGDATSILTDYLYGAFDMYNMTHDDKLDYEDIIYIVEGYETC